MRLSRHFVVPHISTGDMLRAAVREGTELGRMAKTVIEGGHLVSDDIIIGIVAERLSSDDARTRGYILDGFPRTVPQAEALDGITAERPIDVVIDLDVPREMVFERITSRRVCRDCGANYTAAKVLASGPICEACGGEVVQREDDTPDAIARRLDIYEEQTAPLIEYYGHAGRLVVVNGVGTPDAVFARLTGAVENAKRRR